MLGQPHLRSRQREAVPGHMILRNRIPAAMFDGHAGLAAHGLEAHIDMCELVWRKASLAP